MFANPVRDTRAFRPNPGGDWAEWRPRRRPKRPPVTPAARRGSTPAPEERPPTPQRNTLVRFDPRTATFPEMADRVGPGVVRHMVAAPNGQRRGR